MKKIVIIVLSIILILFPMQTATASTISSNQNCEVTATVDGAFYTVTFNYLEEDGETTNISNIYEQGKEIQIPVPPLNCEDKIYNYIFSSWTPEIETICTQNKEYTAQYETEYKNYTVTFYDYDGTIIRTDAYHYGDFITIPESPERASDNEHIYEFAGWSQVVNARCEGNAEYTATYIVDGVPEYGVTFKDDKGKVISSKIYKKGEKIDVPEIWDSYSDRTYKHTFVGWTPELNPICEGMVEYTAVYDQEFIEYVVSFVSYDESVIDEGVYTYGEPINVPSAPEKDSTFLQTYTFSDWDVPLSPYCVGSATYKAMYAANFRATPTATVLSTLTVVTAVTTTGFANLAWTFLLGLIFWKKRARLVGYYGTKHTKIVNYVTSSGKKIRNEDLNDITTVQEQARLFSEGEIDISDFFGKKNDSSVVTVMPYKAKLTFTVSHEKMEHDEHHTLTDLRDSLINKMLYEIISESTPGTQIIMTFRGSGKKIYSEVKFEVK